MKPWDKHFCRIFGVKLERSWIELYQSLKYCEKHLVNHKTRGSSGELNGVNAGFRLNQCSSMFSTFMISKNISISKQNWAVPVASGVPYVDRTLLTNNLDICAASLTFIIEYGVNSICSYVIFARICKPYSLSSLYLIYSIKFN